MIRHAAGHGTGRLEDALADGSRTRALLDTTSDAAVLYTPDGAVLARNALSRELLGDDDERLQLGSFDSVEGWRAAGGGQLTPEDHPAVIARTTTGRVTQLLSIQRPDGRRRWARAGACSVADAAGPGELVLTLSDTTDLHAARMDLARAREDLREVATVAAHDLGVPLAALRAELAAVVPGALTHAADGLRAARAAADAMQEIVGAVLSYAEVDGEVIQGDMVDLNATAGEVVAMLGGRVQETGATVRVEALPRVRGCSVLLRQLMQNLVHNAIAHHPGPAPNIVIRSERRGDTSVVIVEDDGDGIPASHREGLFMLFARGCSSAPGRGIGLSAARRIVERHGGQIWIEDVVPHGARFCMTF